MLYQHPTLLAESCRFPHFRRLAKNIRLKEDSAPGWETIVVTQFGHWVIVESQSPRKLKELIEGVH